LGKLSEDNWGLCEDNLELNQEAKRIRWGPSKEPHVRKKVLRKNGGGTVVIKRSEGKNVKGFCRNMISPKNLMG